jgi:hypothetical protein
VFTQDRSAIEPIPLCGLRDLRAMHFPIGLVLARKPRCCLKTGWPLNPFPSVASATSVRCIPHWPGSRAEAAVLPQDRLAIEPIPLRDLRDLRAMHFPIGLVLARKPRCSLKTGWPSNTIPFRDLRDLRAMHFPIGLVLARKPRCSLKTGRPSNPSPSVASATSVRCISPLAWFSHGSRGVHSRPVGH